MFRRRLRQTLVSVAVSLAAMAGVAGSVGTTALTPEVPGHTDATELPVDGGTPKELPLPVPPAEVAETADPAVQTVGTIQVDGPTDIPAGVLAAYRAAEATTARVDPGCHLDWTLLAAIGRIESGHARGGSVDAKGTTTSPILGPVLSGGPDIAAIRDTDGGRHDGDTVWDRAVGPMQFIPSTWASWARDGNGDGSADPHNVYDAALAAAGYLCVGERDLADSGQLRRAVFGYNHSWDYVATVLAWMRAYAQGGSLTPVALAGTGGGLGTGGGGLGAGDDGTNVAVLATTKRAAAVTAARAVSGTGPSGTTSGSATAPTPAPSATAPSPSTPPSDPTPPPSSEPPASEPTPDPTQPPASDPPPEPTPEPTCPSPSPTPTETPTPTPSPSPSEDPCAASQPAPAEPTPSP